MSSKLKLVLVSTPVGHLGSGKGGGVELTIISLIKGLLNLGHQVVLVAPENSVLHDLSSDIEITLVEGTPQPSWQHQQASSPVLIPPNGVLPRLLGKALDEVQEADAILNFSYDWLPIWLTPFVKANLFHLVSMGAVSDAMQSVIKDFPVEYQNRLAFHTSRQASDYELLQDPVVVGNGFELSNYDFQLSGEGALGWAGRVAPEKGLEDAVAVAASLGDRLLVWGFIEDKEYAASVEASVPDGTIDWRGFLPTLEFQKQLGTCRAFINTPKWNEAYGNVVVEAMACGVPVVAYDRGGPGEIINNGVTGWLVKPDNVQEMTIATSQISKLNRKECRKWVEDNASNDIFAKRIIRWIESGLSNNKLCCIN